MIQKGSNVKWDWGNGVARGKVVETYDREVEKEIGGTTVTRRGETGNKALLIKQADGSEVLKLEDEVVKDS